MKASIENLYQLDGRVPLAKALPFGLQHVLAMFVSNITPIMILAAAVGLDSAMSAALIQNCMVIAGIGTLVQLFPIWRVGSRLPIVMGISFTFLSLAISIAGAYGMGTLVGAVIVGGLVEGLLGLFVKYWIRLIPHVVSATVVTAIGFSLLPIGANSFAGGQGAPDFGSLNNWIVAPSRCWPVCCARCLPRAFCGRCRCSWASWWAMCWPAAWAWSTLAACRRSRSLRCLASCPSPPSLTWVPSCR